MRHIIKGNEPHSLGLERAALRRTPGLYCDLYGKHLNSATRQDILLSCLREQQGLCAYTGMDASDGKGHVEHLVPRSVSCPENPPESFEERPFETISWENLVACYPLNPSGCSYGAGKKGNWPADAELGQFISPINPTCERRFRYGKRCTVRPTDESDLAAARTIEKLGLDHRYLDETRRAVLEVDMRVKDPAKRRRLLARLEDRTSPQAPEFAFQRSQVLRREWAGTV